MEEPEPAGRVLADDTQGTRECATHTVATERPADPGDRAHAAILVANPVVGGRRGRAYVASSSRRAWSMKRVSSGLRPGPPPTCPQFVGMGLSSALGI